MEYEYTNTGSRVGQELRHCARLARRVIACVGACALAGCPSYEDGYSGTYLEERQAGREELMAIDLFRFGDYADAVLRVYPAPEFSTPDEILAGGESRCDWTSTGAAPDEQGRLHLQIDGRSQERAPIDVQIQFTGEASLTATITGGDPLGEPTSEVTRTFRLYSESPNNDCVNIRPFLVQVDMNNGGRAQRAASRGPPHDAPADVRSCPLLCWRARAQRLAVDLGQRGGHEFADRE